MQKSTKILLSVFFTLTVVIGGFYLIYSSSPFPEIQGDYFPNQKQKISYNAPLKIIFSNKMNQALTEKVFQISPEIEGELSWENSYTLVFTPKNKFKIGENLTVSVSKVAQDYLGKNLIDDFSMDFFIVGAPRVIFVSPANEAELATIRGEETTEEMDRESVVLPYSPSLYSDSQKMPKITIMFDRPIRELTTLDKSKTNQEIDFIQFEPEIQGTYKWLSTSTVQFIPDELPMSTTFEARILKGTQALDAGYTEEEYVWHFETERPRLLSSTPEQDEQFFDPKKEIKLHFNQQVDLDTLYQELNFYPPKDGFFNGEITFESNDLTTVIIQPKPKLVHPENYTLSLQEGVRGLNGTKSSEEEIKIQFKTYDQAKVKEYFPKDGTTDVKNYDIAIDFTTPMQEESVQERLTVEPEISNLNVYLIDDDTRAVVRGNFKPGQSYKIFLKKGSKDVFNQLIYNNLEYEFTMADASPYLSLMSRGSKGLFSEEIPPEYYLRTINLNKVNFELCSVSESRFLETEKNYDWSDFSCDDSEKWSLQVDNVKNVYQTTAVPLNEEIQDKGIYFLSVYSDEYLRSWKRDEDDEAEPYRYNQVFFVTNSALSLKHTDHESLVWATDMVTGEPLEKAQIQIKDLYSGEILKQGRTDENGLFQTDLETKNRFYVFAKKDEKWGLVGSNWSDGISTWDFDLQRGWYDDQRNFAYLYTDRPIYRPNQEVFFKGIVRQEEDVKFSLPTEDFINVEIEDSLGNIVLDKKLEINSNGSFNGKLDLDEEAETGRYYLSANYENNYFSRIFWVEEYRKPEFKVEVISKKTDFVNHNNFKAEIQGSYYFGGALPDAPVSWTLSSDNYFFDQYEGEWYNFSANDNNYGGCGWWNDCEPEENIVDSGDGKLNQNGKLKIDLPIDLANKKMSQLYTLTATVTDLNNQQVSNQQTFIIHKGNYYVGIKNEDYVSQINDKTTFKILTVDSAGEPLKNKLVSVDFYKREWNSVKKEGIDGSFYWENEAEDTLVSSEKTSTDNNGKATIGFTPKEGGYYIAKAKSVDADGNEIIAQSSVYISSSDYVGWGVNNHDRIDLVVDKTNYQVGDTANILVKSPFEESVKALFTIERQGILSYKILELEKNSEIIKLPITEEMLPNVYVSVLLFKGSGEAYKVILAQEEIDILNEQIAKNIAEKENMATEIKKLKLEIAEIQISQEQQVNSQTSDQKNLTNENNTIESTSRPTNEVRLEVKQSKLKEAQAELEKSEQVYIELIATKNAQNAEIKAIKQNLDSDTLAKIETGQFSEFPRPEFKLGYTNILVNTEEKRLTLDLKTDKERYHAGETVNLKVVTKDQENKGVPAEISLAIVDESVLALKSRNLEDLVDYFYEKRGLKIKNAQSLVYFIERLNVKAQKGEKGGGGGSDENSTNKKRGEFKDTTLWEPNLQTDENGEVEISFVLPDNLTTWQILAIGATQDTIVGSTEKDFMTTQDLIVRSVLPRFLIMNDSVQVGAIVHNNTGDTENIKISLSGENFEILSEETQKVEIADQAEKEVTWEIKVKQGNAEDFAAKFNFKAEASTISDEVEQTLPVKSFSVPEVVSTSGVTTDLAKEKIYFPQSVDNDLGELKINLAATLATNLKDGLEFLSNFSYGCAEQTMSHHLLNVILKQFDKILQQAQDDTLNIAELDEMVSEGLQKLYSFQRYDGGWGYWSDSNYSYPYLSAYILFGLNETQKAGYNIDQKVLDKGTLYLKEYLNNPQKFTNWQQVSVDDQAFALWVLSQLDEAELSLSLKLMDDIDKLSLYAKGYLFMDFMELTRTQKNTSIQKILQQKISILKTTIENSAIIDTRGVHFEETEQNYQSMNSNTRTTAILLKAFIQNDVENPLIPKMMNWLRTQKQDGHWSNTQETVWSLIAFTDYFQTSSELDANYNVKMTLNGKEKINQIFDVENLFTREELITEINDLRIGMPSNEILFSKEGEGNLYYDITAKYYLPLEEIPERSEGISLIRKYSNLEDSAEKEITETKVGDILKGKLTIIAPEDRHFVLVEEYLPAGFEPINFNLETEDENLQSEINQNKEKNYWWKNGIWRFYHREFRDDRISLFADYLPAGIYEYEFLVRVTSAGEFHHLPAQAYEMYFPENFGRTSGKIFKIKEQKIVRAN